MDDCPCLFCRACQRCTVVTVLFAWRTEEDNYLITEFECYECGQRGVIYTGVS